MGFCNAVLTGMLAAWPLFAPVHFLSLIIQVHHLVCESPDVLSLLFLSSIQPDTVSTVHRQVRHAWLPQVSVDGHQSLLRKAFPGHRGRQPTMPQDSTRVDLHRTYHSLPVIYLLVYLLLSGSPLGCKLHEAMNPCVCRAEPDT